MRRHPVIRKSLRKWNRRFEQYEDFESWWIQSGMNQCSFCNLFQPPTQNIGYKICGRCPLKAENSDKICAEEWMQLRNMYFNGGQQDIETINKLIRDMYDMIATVDDEYIEEEEERAERGE